MEEKKLTKESSRSWEKRSYGFKGIPLELLGEVSSTMGPDDNPVSVSRRLIKSKY